MILNLATLAITEAQIPLESIIYLKGDLQYCLESHFLLP